MPGAPPELQQRYIAGNLSITGRALNLRAAAADCDAGVNHGDHLVVAALLAAGKPQLSLPNFMPERVTAEKVMALGAGLRTASDASQFAADLKRLLEDTGLADKARDCAAKLTDLDTEMALRRCVENVAAQFAARL